jgi:hypothetical protein
MTMTMTMTIGAQAVLQTVMADPQPYSKKKMCVSHISWRLAWGKRGRFVPSFLELLGIRGLELRALTKNSISKLKFNSNSG